MANKSIPLTIFTPTYNRGYILPELYNSLRNQTCKEFQWLIIDDGSNDNTENLVKLWQAEERLFAIKYIKQENAGKQMAHNRAVQECDTELFFCVDSDDKLTSDAVDIILDKWKLNCENAKVAGIIALRGKDNETPLGTYLPKCSTATLISLYQKYAFKGDTALIYKTSVLRKYPFRLFNGEKFIGENYVYDQIDQEYTMILENKIIYICSYLEDGYTKSTQKLLRNNPYSYMVLKKQAAQYSLNLKYKVRNMAGYIAMGLAIREKHLVKKSGNRGLALISFPFGVIIWKVRFK